MTGDGDVARSPNQVRGQARSGNPGINPSFSLDHPVKPDDDVEANRMMTRK
jgi:hypothetical protein